MARVELIFGLGTGNGEVGERQWRDFLAAEVTPRFPDGLTVFDGYGQWKDPAKGGIGHERSKLLLIWYQPTAGSETKIQAIRDAYKTRYNQLSVMRIDGQDCVSF